MHMGLSLRIAILVPKLFFHLHWNLIIVENEAKSKYIEAIAAVSLC